MPKKTNCFTAFKSSIKDIELPKQFTFPFYYTPHPLCIQAAQELQEHLLEQKSWRHNFGLDKNEENPIGKMFGVLLVQNENGKIGYLAAFSGKMAGVNHLPGFVPPIYDMLDENSFFMKGQLKLNDINKQVKKLQVDQNYIDCLNTVINTKAEAEKMITEQRLAIIEGRKHRKAKRQIGAKELSEIEFIELKDKLSKESVAQKNQLKHLTKLWADKIELAESDLNKFQTEIDALKEQRKKLSNSLQQQLFEQYNFLNAIGEQKNLSSIFAKTNQEVPPAAAGECAAPKLLQYAFENNLKPIAMAEFWWGESPKSAIRKHGQFYPACQGKCQPILGHMLQGLDVEENPLLSNPAEGKSIEIVYEDEELLVINKPAEFLSVPGKAIQDSVYQRMKIQFPKATGPLIVHRLDMSTSGLMLIAKNKDSHKKLQRQFINRKVKKRYVALLDGLLKEEFGIIELPLRVDLDDRPRQLVCYEHGKNATTKWEVIERENGRTKIHFYPITGRTHQLRVHAAHASGLNTPIVGDDLYGKKDRRLHLHAESITFKHPQTNDTLSFNVQADF